MIKLFTAINIESLLKSSDIIYDRRYYNGDVYIRLSKPMTYTLNSRSSIKTNSGTIVKNNTDNFEHITLYIPTILPIYIDEEHRYHIQPYHHIGNALGKTMYTPTGAQLDAVYDNYFPIGNYNILPDIQLVLQDAVDRVELVMVDKATQ